MARIEVRRDVVGERGEPLERLGVVRIRARVELDADQQLRMLAPRELSRLLPVRADDILPLPLADTGEVREPAARVEMRCAIAGRPRGTARHSDDPVDA